MKVLEKFCLIITFICIFPTIGWLLMHIPGCGDTYVLDGLRVDAKVLTEYNVIIYYENRDICGGTVIFSSDTRTQVITAAHCVDNEGIFYIMPNNGKLYMVKVSTIDTNADVALLETLETPIPIQPYASIPLGEPQLGENIWAIGNGAGEADSLSRGIVSKLSIKDHYGQVKNQFEIVAWYGSSGGGLFNEWGQLVGVMSQFGPQFNNHGPETGWMYGATVANIKSVLYR